MLRLRVLFERGPMVEVECEPRDGALLLQELAGEWGAPVGPADAPPRFFETPQTGAAEAQSPATGSRTYGGRLNRRELVLTVLRELCDSGTDTPSLAEIKARFQSRFPSENLAHLDQVVRDLANKTDLVDRCDRGRFRLHRPS